MSRKTRSPLVRASTARDMLVIIDQRWPGTRDAVRRLVPARSLEVIDGAAASSWIPVEHHHWLVDGTVKVLGVDRAVASWRIGMSGIFERPLHRFFVESAVRLFLGRPGMIIGLIPRGWALAYRDICDVSFQATGERTAEIHFDDIAPEALQSPGYLHSWHAICQAALDLESPKGGKTELTVDTAKTSAMVRFAWEASDD